MQPVISVCIPVYNTEPYLLQCLRSVIIQDFENFEVIVVSDSSPGKDEKGRGAKKLVRLAQKECNRIRKSRKLPKVPFRFIEHRENRGVVEVRRTLCYEARGLFITQLDSDDELEADALTALYQAAGMPASAQTEYFDIVHGTSSSGFFTKNQDGNFIFTASAENRYGQIFYGEIYDSQVFHKWIVDKLFTAHTWGKLIKRELWLKAYESIPYTECNMADDLLIFFFISQYARSYKGIQTKVYRYRMNSGMSSDRKIDSLHKWKMICSAASVFSVISTWIKENPVLSEEETDRIRYMTRFYLANNIRQLQYTVIPQLKSQARQLLCDYWGQHFVETIELELSQESVIK